LHESLRQRAQQAATLAAAVVAAIIAAGAAGAISHRPLFVRLLGAAALVSWIATAALYLRSMLGVLRVSASIRDTREEQFDLG
jgi:hypothetical protein